MKKYKCTIISNERTELKEFDTEPTLEQFQAMVHGDIEPVVVNYKGEAKQALVNEEGSLKKLPLNYRAFFLTDQFFVGNVIILENFSI